jgi:hypothetical protein
MEERFILSKSLALPCIYYTLAAVPIHYMMYSYFRDGTSPRHQRSGVVQPETGLAEDGASSDIQPCL